MSNGERLQGALKLLGYENSKEPFDRSNLVLAIQFFAGVQQDDVVAWAQRVNGLHELAANLGCQA